MIQIDLKGVSAIYAGRKKEILPILPVVRHFLPVGDVGQLLAIRSKEWHPLQAVAKIKAPFNAIRHKSKQAHVKRSNFHHETQTLVSLHAELVDRGGNDRLYRARLSPHAALLLL